MRDNITELEKNAYICIDNPSTIVPCVCVQIQFVTRDKFCVCLFQSGAKINISDGACPERIVTVAGNTDSIYKAFTLICNKFEEVKKNEKPLGYVDKISFLCLEKETGKKAGPNNLVTRFFL